MMPVHLVILAGLVSMGQQGVGLPVAVSMASDGHAVVVDAFGLKLPSQSSYRLLDKKPPLDLLSRKHDHGWLRSVDPSEHAGLRVAVLHVQVSALHAVLLQVDSVELFVSP